MFIPKNREIKFSNLLRRITYRRNEYRYKGNCNNNNNQNKTDDDDELHNLSLYDRV